jgi:hypothetical protein
MMSLISKGIAPELRLYGEQVQLVGSLFTSSSRDLFTPPLHTPVKAFSGGVAGAVRGAGGERVAGLRGPLCTGLEGGWCAAATAREELPDGTAR